MQREGRVLRIYWGEEAIKKFKRLFPTTTNEELAIEFLCSERTIIRRARKLGLEKDPEVVAAKWEVNRKLTYRNPNRDYTALIERTKKYRFKKGVTGVSGSFHSKPHTVPLRVLSRPHGRLYCGVFDIFLRIINEILNSDIEKPFASWYNAIRFFSE